MIRLHRLAHRDEPFHLNPDLIVTVEATPDTVIALVSGIKLVVQESPEDVVEAVRCWRASVLAAGLKTPRRAHSGLSVVRATTADGGVSAHLSEVERRP